MMLSGIKFNQKTKRGVLWAVVVVWCMLIFGFSAQPAKTSSKTSRTVTAKVLKALPSVKKLSPQRKKKTIDTVHNYIRKLAHFSLYFILGIWLCLLAKSYGLSFCQAFFVALLACAFYAATDEIHQLFVEGRSCQLLDVAIDSGGAVAGILLTSAVCGRFAKTN